MKKKQLTIIFIAALVSVISVTVNLFVKSLLIAWIAFIAITVAGIILGFIKAGTKFGEGSINAHNIEQIEKKQFTYLGWPMTVVSIIGGIFIAFAVFNNIFFLIENANLGEWWSGPWNASIGATFGVFVIPFGIGVFFAKFFDHLEELA